MQAGKGYLEATRKLCEMLVGKSEAKKLRSSGCDGMSFGGFDQRFEGAFCSHLQSSSKTKRHHHLGESGIDRKTQDVNLGEIVREDMKHIERE
jgi:hypothetical protein